RLCFVARKHKCCKPAVSAGSFAPARNGHPRESRSNTQTFAEPAVRGKPAARFYRRSMRIHSRVVDQLRSRCACTRIDAHDQTRIGRLPRFDVHSGYKFSERNFVWNYSGISARENRCNEHDERNDKRNVQHVASSMANRIDRCSNGNRAFADYRSGFADPELLSFDGSETRLPHGSPAHDELLTSVANLR